MGYAKVIGNHGKAFEGSRRGGNGQAPDGTINWVAVYGQAAGDVAYIKAAGFNSYQTKLSYAVQGSAGTVEFTLMNEEEASNPNPDVQASVLWGNSITASGDIQAVVDANKIPVGFTVAKVTFAGPGVLYLFGR